MSETALEALRRALEEYEEGLRASGEDDKSRRERLLNEEKARQIATRSLNAAPRTRSQLEQKLQEKDIPDDVISHVLDRYEDVGLVDDAEFAREWIRSRASAKGVAAPLLREELGRKGIPRHIIEDALEESLAHEDERSFGMDLTREKTRAVVRRMGVESIQDRAGREKALRKIVAAVARKGHSPSEAFRWAADALDEELLEH